MEDHKSLSAAQTMPIGNRAASDLSFIRASMERACRFTAVPGWGGVLIGSIALVAAAWSLWSWPDEKWVFPWLLAVGIACPAHSWALLRKARRQRLSVVRGGGPAFLLGLFPTLVAGAVMTAVLWQAGRVDLLPQTWLLLYGAAVVTAGALTIRVVPIMGLGFMFLGIVAAVVPSSWGIPLLAAGFGGLHIGFGIWIGVRHGG